MRNSPTAAALLFAALAVAACAAASATPFGGAPRPEAAQDPAKAAETPAAEEPKPSADEIAIRETAQAFVKAFNEGDAKAASLLFVETGEILREDEPPIRGREAILASFEETFAESAGATIELFDESIRFLTPDLAIEEGRSIVTPAPDEDGSEGEPARSRYTVHYAKVGGKWLQASVRDVTDVEPTVEDRLKELEWLLGDWVDEGKEGMVETVGRMDPSGKYILRDFKTNFAGTTTISGVERIGWDPLSKQIKSWVFDSEGGYGEALWTKSDDGWVLKAKGVLPDGRIASATRYLTYVNKDRVLFRSTDRVAGGSMRPDVDEVVLVRKPPAPAARGAKKAEEPAKPQDK